MLITIVTFIIVFGILVVVHEFGHFYFAKRAGILVREFSIGMGPKIFAHQKNGTTYTIRILPLGGYVRMAGLEDDDESLKPGATVSLLLNQDNVVETINTSKKKTLLSGIPVEIVKWDLEQELWIEGYENGEEDKYQRYSVLHDASIIEEDGTKVRIAPLDVQFQSAKLWQRMLTNFAGPLNNFILTIVAFTLVAVLQGGVVTSVSSTKIGAFSTSSVAKKAGLKVGDKIIAVDGKKTSTWQKLASFINASPNKKISVTYERNSEKKTVDLIPKSQNQNGKKVGLIGIEAKTKVDSSFRAIATYGFIKTWTTMLALFSAIGGMFTHGFSLNDLGGPVAIYSYTSEAAQYGLTSVIGLLAFLSINLGIVNLFPIPALDGGKIILNIIEAIRKKPLSPEKEGMITLIGFGFLMLLMVLVTWNDINRYFFK
ncbi:RIP metalloprotease RseP [Liquorilactobacillus cacaonum]|uniref:Zinc metalloprotease n=1 Tax=Liquorilactobacillus cacaonum DSM 21116 TaxID=1423729 RepID=A0A0R2CHF7_9LACO|nr:RIP metalloprotease RseP [Liquorilactobacillus cacaonum]KRM91064.1 M50 family membrane endopeptidase [Liquorilactobacillus cacaonum DSM 21116]